MLFGIFGKARLSRCVFMVAGQSGQEVESGVRLSSLFIDLGIRQIDRKSHEPIGNFTVMFNSLQQSLFQSVTAYHSDLRPFHFRSLTYVNNSSETTSLVQFLNTFVDFLKTLEVMSNVCVDRPFPSYGFIDQLGNVLGTLPSSECSSQPFPSSHQLERPRCDFLASSCNSDYATLTETSMGSLKSLSHNRCISSGVESVINSPLLNLKQEGLAVLLRSGLVADICSKLAGYLELSLVYIDSIYLRSSSNLGRLNHRKTHSSQTPHSNCASRFHIAVVHDRAPSSAHSTTDHANLVEISKRVNFCNRNFSNHCVLAEGRASHEVVDGLSIFVSETRSRVRHEALSLSSSDSWAKVCVWMLTVNARFFLALGSIARNDSVTNLNSGHSGAHAFHDSCCLVAQDNWEDAFGVASVQTVNISMAESIGNDSDSYLTGLGWIHLNLFNSKRLVRFVGNCGLAFDDLRLSHLN